ncbi:putative cullin family protein [Lyophyllum shimeji]|uniref:Cullin family protein n=1 Tax=Lyophyllum shimeji TaxID=47721 RepID=A0A9P3PJW2_LYOSH|nr:putative cullin family protein [Lyophyllum shimeji]
MTDVFTLLTLPKTSNAFTSARSTVTETLDDGSQRTRNQGPIKIRIIGDHATQPTDESSYLNQLRRSIRTILTRNSGEPLPTTYEGIYSACRYVVCVANKGEGLYGTLRIELEQSIGRLANSLSAGEVAKDQGVEWIEKFVEACDWFEKQISLLRSVLTYLDQVYVVHNPDEKNIHSLAYSQFTERIFENLQIALRLRNGVSEWATYEREHRMAHPLRHEIPKLVAHLVTHKQYSSFEEYFIKIADAWYTAKSEEMARSMKDDAKGFFEFGYSRIDEECQRAMDVLPIGSWTIVRETAERAIWNGRLEWLATETVGPFVDSNDLSTLLNMYERFSRVNGLKVLVSAFRVYLQARVQTIVKDVDNDDNMVQRLLDFKRLADTAIRTAFLDDPARSSDNNGSTSVLNKQPNNEFFYALTDAFTIGFKARRNKPAEMIAKYLDRAMRRGQGATSDAEFEALLDSVLALYRYTEDKDVFRTFYHRSLAKRLLLEKSASDDFEAAMLKKLKEQYDPEFGMGEDMFKDLALSREAMREYHSKLDIQSAGHKLTAMVLQRSAWPFSVQKTSIDLPASMQAELTAYANYYKERHSGHVLDWDHALGTAMLKARFNHNTKELSVSLYQAVVLLLFNDSEEWRYPDILAQTRMDEGELKRTLQSLALGKKKVLRKVPGGRDVNDGDLFKFNGDFDDPRPKVHINSIQAKVSPEESKRTNESIEGDRKHYLDAAIVRIMKARKELTYEQLKTATIEAVKNHFVPMVDAIKKRVDALVESDYLERSAEDKNKFLYVA